VKSAKTAKETKNKYVRFFSFFNNNIDIKIKKEIKTMNGFIIYQLDRKSFFNEKL